MAELNGEDGAPAAPKRVLLEQIDAGVVGERIAELRQRLAAATPAGATPPELLIASKYFAPSAIPALVQAGATLLGENRAEVIAEKRAAAGAGARWDYIGELQSRKAAGIADLVSRIHTLATTSAVRKLRAHADGGAALPELLVQVNVAGEAGKGGIAPGELPALLKLAAGLPVVGLMTMPPLAERAADNRRWFAALRQLADEHGLAQCSMGTSQDVLVAAQEGATVVRVGGLLTSEAAWQRLVSDPG